MSSSLVVLAETFWKKSKSGGGRLFTFSLSGIKYYHKNTPFYGVEFGLHKLTLGCMEKSEVSKEKRRNHFSYLTSFYQNWVPQFWLQLQRQLLLIYSYSINLIFDNFYGLDIHPFKGAIYWVWFLCIFLTNELPHT